MLKTLAHARSVAKWGPKLRFRSNPYSDAYRQTRKAVLKAVKAKISTANGKEKAAHAKKKAVKKAKQAEAAKMALSNRMRWQQK